jgi:hypothetical protein
MLSARGRSGSLYLGLACRPLGHKSGAISKLLGPFGALRQGWVQL